MSNKNKTYDEVYSLFRKKMQNKTYEKIADISFIVFIFTLLAIVIKWVMVGEFEDIGICAALALFISLFLAIVYSCSALEDFFEIKDLFTLYKEEPLEGQISFFKKEVLKDEELTLRILKAISEIDILTKEQKEELLKTQENIAEKTFDFFREEMLKLRDVKEIEEESKEKIKKTVLNEIHKKILFEGKSR